MGDWEDTSDTLEPHRLHRYAVTHRDNPSPFETTTVSKPPEERRFDVYQYTPELAIALAMSCAFDVTDISNWFVTANNEVPTELVYEPQAVEIL